MHAVRSEGTTCMHCCHGQPPVLSAPCRRTLKAGPRCATPIPHAQVRKQVERMCYLGARPQHARVRRRAAPPGRLATARGAATPPGPAPRARAAQPGRLLGRPRFETSVVMTRCHVPMSVLEVFSGGNTQGHSRGEAEQGPVEEGWREVGPAVRGGWERAWRARRCWWPGFAVTAAGAPASRQRSDRPVSTQAAGPRRGSNDERFVYARHLQGLCGDGVWRLGLRDGQRAHPR